MPTVPELLAAARHYGATHDLPYAGAVTPAQAFALLQGDPQVRLVDVRTQAERDWVGRVSVAPGQLADIEWNGYPGGAQNPHFLAQLGQVAGKDTVLLFLCRSGVRSRGAATLATQHGYAHCFDVLEGFEGDKDGAGHRKNVGGWCYRGLPWVGA